MTSAWDAPELEGYIGTLLWWKAEMLEVSALLTSYMWVVNLNRLQVDKKLSTVYVHVHVATLYKCEKVWVCKSLTFTTC